jgi:hypothetical protein
MHEPSDRGPLGAAGGRLFALLGGASALGYVAAVLLVSSDYTPPDFLRFFSVFFLLACVWGVTLWLAHKVEPARGVVLAGAVLFRLLLVPAGWSPDTGRFLQRILYGEPAWMSFTNGGAWPYVLACKLAVVGGDLAAVWLLARLAGPGPRGAVALLAYAWNPFVIKEFAGSGHVDAFLVCFLLIACSRREAASGLPLAAAGFIHPAALAMAPPLFRRFGWMALFGPLGAAVFLWLIGYRLDDALGPFHPPLDQVLPGPGAAKLASGAAAVLAAMAWRLWRDDGSATSLHRYAIWVFGALLLATPLFAPWRIVWLLPFAALELSWFWLALSGSMFLAYHAGLSFRDIPALALLQFAMPLLVWLWLNRHLPHPPPAPYNRSCARSDSKS